MGYTIRIGEYESINEDGFRERAALVDSVRNAPMDYRGRRTNELLPSYDAWYSFLEAYNIKEHQLLHWKGDGGIIDVTEQAVKSICEAQQPEVENQFDLNALELCARNEERFKWLCFWLRWAVQNCKRPVISWS